LILPAALRDEPRETARPLLRASIVPRTHLFGERVTAVVEAPAGSEVRATFAPYRVLRNTTSQAGRTTRHEFTLDCVRSRCVGDPGGVREQSFPPAQIVLPNGREALISWPQLRQASRLAPGDLRTSRLRGELAAPPRVQAAADRGRGLLLAVAAALAITAGGILGFRWLGRRTALRTSNGHRTTSPLDYALLVTGLAAGGGQETRRSALESLALALDDRGLGELAGKARTLAWSEAPPAGESLRRLGAEAQQAAKGGR
jgi:hypothetical protein